MNKFNKGKTVGIVAASLAAVSLIGVGFSAWIINTKSDPTSVGDISVTVADTKNIAVTIGDAKVDDNVVKFDADHTKRDSGNILSCGDSDTEDLTFSLKYTVTVGTDASAWEIKAAIDDTAGGGNGKFTSAVSAKYFTLPDTLGIKTASADDAKTCFNQSSTTGSNGLTFTSTTTDATASATGTSSKTYTVTQAFTFAWGEAFAKKNPVAVTTSDSIWTGTSNETADATNLPKNTTAMKSLNLSTFKVILSVGTVSLNAATA